MFMIVKKFFYPEIPFEKSEYISKYATSCIDISDGLIKDLGSICKKSGVGAEIIFENIPINVSLLSYTSKNTFHAIRRM